MPTKTKTATKNAEATPTVSKVFRALSAVFLIDKMQFDAETADSQTKVIETAAGLPIKFLPSFGPLSDRKRIRDKLLSGEDVSIELEFNAVELSEADQAALAAVRPVLAMIDALGPKYNWLPAIKKPAELTLNGDNVNRNGYRLSKTQCKRIWDKASRIWSGGKSPGSCRVTEAGGWRDRTVSVKEDRVDIGCQNVTRAEVELIARHFEFEPNVG